MDLSLPQLVSDYGYLAVFVGTVLEGEAVVLLAAYAAHEGYLSLPIVIGVACVGATLGDQIFFFIGRRFGTRLLARFPVLRERAARVDQMLLRHPGPVIIGVRFAYGLRIAGPIAIGMSSLEARRFLLFNAIGALIWAPLIAAAGFAFGQTLDWLFVDLKRFESFGFVALIAVIVVVVGIGHWRRNQRPPP